MDLAKRASVVNTLTTMSAMTTTTAKVTTVMEHVSNVPTVTHSPNKASALVPQIKYEKNKLLNKFIRKSM